LISGCALKRLPAPAIQLAVMHLTRFVSNHGPMDFDIHAVASVTAPVGNDVHEQGDGHTASHERLDHPIHLHSQRSNPGVSLCNDPLRRAIEVLDHRGRELQRSAHFHAQAVDSQQNNQSGGQDNRQSTSATRASVGCGCPGKPQNGEPPVVPRLEGRRFACVLTTRARPPGTQGGPLAIPLQGPHSMQRMIGQRHDHQNHARHARATTRSTM